MSVKTPVFKFDVPVLGEEANVPADLLSLATEIENVLKALEPKFLKTAGVGDSGKLLIVDATGAPAFKAMSGAGTINASGVFGLNNEAVATANIAQLAIETLRLANEAVTTEKLKALAVTAAKLAAECVESSKIKNLAVITEKLGELAVTTAKIANEAVTDAKLASPNNTMYRNLIESVGLMANGDIAGGSPVKYLLGSIATKTGRMMGAGLNSINMAEEFAHRPPDLLDFAAADYAVAGKTQKMRLRCAALVGGNTVATTLAFSLYPITPAGGAGVYEPTIGAAVASSTSSIVNPPVGTATRAATADFTIPADGVYVIGVTTSVAIGASPVIQVAARLQHRNV